MATTTFNSPVTNAGSTPRTGFNLPIATYNKRYLTPKYTPSELLALSSKGYVGAFKKGSTTFLSPMGPAYSTVNALRDLRAGKYIKPYADYTPYNEYGTHGVNIGGNELDAATAPTRQDIINYIDKANSFTKRYGADGAKYVKQYGKLPSEDSKFADLFAESSKVVKASAVASFQEDNYGASMMRYQQSLSDSLASMGNNLREAARKDPSLAPLDIMGVEAITAASNYRPTDKYSTKSIAALKQALRMDPMDNLSTDKRWSKDIAEAIGSVPQFDTGLLQSALSVMPGMTPVSARVLANSGVVESALVKLNDVTSNPKSVLAPEDVNESNALDLVGGLFANSVRSLGRMSAGFPLGMYMAADELKKGAIEAKKYATGETKSFGEGTDFQLGDAIWADYAQRYYDPFATDKDGKGRNFWQGLTDETSWKAFSQKMSEDPVAPVLDLLGLVPMIGWATKGAALGSTLGKFGRAGRVAGEAAEVTAARAMISEGERVGGVWGTQGAGVLEAKRVVDNYNVGRATLSPRKYRGLLRRAIAGDNLALKGLEDYRRRGLIIPQVGEESFVMRAAAKFEERTKVLDNPRAVGNLEDGSVLALERLPASPLARGGMELATFLRRKIYDKMEDLTKPGAALDSPKGQRVADVLVDLPLVGYRWQYGRALGQGMRYFWGDLATDVHRSQEMLKLREENAISTPMERVVMSVLNGGDGTSALGKFNDPAYQRTVLEQRKGNIETRIANKELNGLDESVIDELDTLNARIAALPTPTDYEVAVRDFQRKLDEPDKVGSPETEAAYRMYQEMLYQRERIKSLVNDEATQFTTEYYKMVYAEAMQALRLRSEHLFGAEGELSKLVNSIVEVDDNFPLASGFADIEDSWRMIMDEDGVNVFEKIDDPAERVRRIDQFKTLMKKLNDDGLFRDASGNSEVRGAPILVLARGAKLNSPFVRVHRIKLDGKINDAGIVERNSLVNKREVLYIPREMLIPRRVPRDRVEKLIEDGSINAMGEYFPNPNFYSDKVSEAGLRGESANFTDLRNDHIVATTGLKEHTMRMQILSQINYLRNRIERDLEEVANANAELVPLDSVLGTNALTLKSVRVFESLDKAEQFARLRGIEAAFRTGVKDYQSGKISPLENPFDIESGFGTINRDGKTLYVVRGDVRDWSTYALRDTTEQLTNPDLYKQVLYEDLSRITADDARGVYAMVVPRRVDNALKQTVIEGNDYATRLLKNPLANAPTNIFKRLVLAFNPRFIPTNVVGGTAMYMMHNPIHAPKTFARAVAHGARRAGIKEWEDIATESDVLDHHLAYEFDNNIYKLDSGIRSVEDATRMGKFRKYGWNGGYTAVRAFEEFMRKAVAKDFLMDDTGFRAFMDGPEVDRYIAEGLDFRGLRRDNITRFEAAADMLLDPRSRFYQHDLKMRMRYTTNTISGNYHSFSPTEQFIRNFLMPFYSWQRHSLAFTTRLPIDRPLTAAILGNVGEYGYAQALSNGGLPSWMYQTVPLPDFIEETLQLSDEDRRISLASLNPFSTTADMSLAAANLLSGKEFGSNIFEFTNPIINTLIKQTMNVDPVTGTQVNENDRKGFFGTLADSMQSMPGIAVPKSLTFDAINGAYADNALANKYRTIDKADDIFRNYDEGESNADWRLYVPEERGTLQAGTYRDQLYNMFFPLKPYSINAERMSDQARSEAVAYGVMNKVQKSEDVSRTQEFINGVQEWQRKRDYVMQVWLPVAKQQLSAEQISMVLAKLNDEKPEEPSGVSFDTTLRLVGG